MSFELLSEVPTLLRPGHLVYFKDQGWHSNYKGKWFTVGQAQQIKYDIGRIVDANSSIDLDFVAPASGGVSATSLSLVPTKEDTLYEQLWGIRGTPLVYPRYNNTYFLKLEVTNVAPDTGDERLRYLGFYDEADSPFEQMRLREYVVKDNDGVPVLRVYNDLDVAEPIDLRVIVNRVQLEKVASPQSIPDAMKGRARILVHHSSFNY